MTGAVSTKYFVIFVAIFSLGALSGWFYRSSRLDDDYNKYAPKHRPQSVPQNAVWAGSQEGGAYIDCYYNQSTDRDDCTVYNDATGEVMVSGSFVLADQHRGATPPELRYSYFDGEAIGLALPARNGTLPTLIRADP